MKKLYKPSKAKNQLLECYAMEVESTTSSNNSDNKQKPSPDPHSNSAGGPTFAETLQEAQAKSKTGTAGK